MVNSNHDHSIKRTIQLTWLRDFELRMEILAGFFLVFFRCLVRTESPVNVGVPLIWFTSSLAKLTVKLSTGCCRGKKSSDCTWYDREALFARRWTKLLLAGRLEEFCISFWWSWTQRPTKASWVRDEIEWWFNILYHCTTPNCNDSILFSLLLIQREINNKKKESGRKNRTVLVA